MNRNGMKSTSDQERLVRTYPKDEVPVHESTYSAIRGSAEQYPGKTAISFFLSGDSYQEAHHITYQTLIEKVTQTANFFHSLNLGSGDVVALILPNVPEAHYVIWGGEAACQILAINPLLEPGQIKELVNSVGAKAVVTMNPITNIDLWDKLQEILPALSSIEHVVGVDIAHYVRGVKGLAAKAIQWQKRSGIKMSAGKCYHNFTGAIRYQNKQGLDFKRAYTPETISSLFCTGGTTGLPKIARRTHQNELSNVLSVVTANRSLLTKDKVILGGLPLFHVNGALVTGLLPFSLGATVVMATPQGYRGAKVLEKFWDIVEHFRINAFSAVPTVYSALMNYPTEGKDLSSLEAGICGAAPMPVETFKTFQEKTGIKILEGYGLTEGTCVSSLNPVHGEQKVGSIGVRVPFQDMECVQVDGEKIVRRCEIDEIGVLAIRGANVFQGYHLDHQNAGLWLYDDLGNRWLNTGDLARQDADGYFWLTGRKKELIVRGGHNIEPKLIEEILCRHPAVTLAAAVGKPDAHAGEVPVCYVQTRPGHPATSAELLAFAGEHIAERAAIPKEVHIVPELPVTAIGKVYKPQLEMQEIEKCIAALAQQEIPGQAVEIKVKQDPKHGVLASVALPNADEEIKTNFAKRLGEYTFRSSCN
ncbi:acyl-CoA synthetase [Marinobacter sp. CA1]|uniref:acyl-CoA synthetase n=1 Tax=Marinobacter sp. CA1 TaxID=2817656 RepID=UPI001D07BF75|nr:acyl-CoA synthetase [Marinobacter sp. CA1]UDL07057.1 acyl-CoA synthetase [Marinobacter sp. CA1]